MPRNLSSHLKKKFHYRFPQQIWSLGYWGTKDAPKLWIEAKDASEGHWYSYDFGNNEINTISPVPAHSSHLQWLKGREKIGVFVRLQSGKNPGIEAIEAYELQQGKRQYAIESQQAKELTEDQLIIQQGNSVLLLDVDSGKILEEQKNSPDVTAFPFESPHHLEESQEQFDAFKQFFSLKFSLHISKGLDYWEGEDKLIFSYYLYDGTWKNYLLVCNHDFQILLHELLEVGDLMGYHTFQIFQNHLLFIQQKLQLEIYEF